MNYSEFEELDEFEMEAFMTMSLPDRFHAYMVLQMCDEEDYQEMIESNHGDYLPLLYQIKKELPEEFFIYFSDLLHELEYDYYKRKFIEAMQGGEAIS